MSLFQKTPNITESRWRGNEMYWAGQVLYWGGQVGAMMVASIMLTSHLLAEVVFCLYGAGIGIIVTHALRAILLYQHRDEITLTQLMLRMAWVSFIPTLVYALLMMPPFYHYNPWDVESTEVTFTLIGMFFWCWFNMITWLALYLSSTYFFNFQRVISEREQLNTELKDAELRALKSNLNPHFLFNALNSLRALVTEDPIRAREAITLLARLLRTTLKNSTQETHPIITEMDTVASYLNLELLRFEDRLQIHIDLDPSLGLIEVPPFSVQTLVENALKHGIARREEGGDVSVNFSLDGDSLLVSVINTGQISHHPENMSGTGLANLKERLKLLYGMRASLTLEEGEGRVTCRMRLPIS